MSDQSVDVAVEYLYVAFANVARPTDIAACPCCLTPEDVDALLVAVPLRELSADTLRLYASSVLHTVGSEDDYQYFLPRILDIACRESFQWPDLEVVTGRLCDAGWLTTWPTPKRDAVRAVLWAVWRRILASPAETPAPGLAPDIDVDTALAAIARAEADLDPYLRHWVDSLSGEHAINAAAQLREFLQWHVRRGATGWMPRNAFWNSDFARLSNWLDSDPLRGAVAATFDATEDPALLEVCVDIEQLLRPH